MLDGHTFLAGERFTIADIWLYVWLEFADSVGQPFDRSLRNLAPWFSRIDRRAPVGRSRPAPCVQAGWCARLKCAADRTRVTRRSTRDRVPQPAALPVDCAADCAICSTASAECA